MADYWPHQRVNQRVTFDEPGTTPTTAGVNVNDKVLKGKKLSG
jgi:taurine dioxygenase